MARRHTSGWKVAIFSIVVFALVFTFFGMIGEELTARNFALMAMAGALLGAIAAPELEPRAFRYPTIWQMCFAILGSILFALKIGAGPGGYVIAVVVGAGLGYSARFWIKYVEPP